MTMSAGKLTDTLSGRQWKQVLERDPSADGRFFYAVRSTGIVCKPTCPSRRPMPANVRFFPTLDEALEAGFRPCRRCHPERTIPAPDPQARAVARAARYLEQHAGERVTTSDLAQATGINRLTLHRAFRRIFGVSPAQYARQQRLKTFDKTIRESTMRVTDAIYDAGFGSSSRLYENSGARLGMTPRDMRNGAHGIAIRYTTTDSPLGRMLVAATDKGICTIAFGEDEDEVIDVLPQPLPQRRADRRDPTHQQDRLARRGRRLHHQPDGRTSHGGHLPARRARHGISAARLAGAQRDSSRRDPKLLRARRRTRLTQRNAGRRRSLRPEPRRRHRSLPSRHRKVRLAHRLPLGHGAQAASA